MNYPLIGRWLAENTRSDYALAVVIVFSASLVFILWLTKTKSEVLNKWRTVMLVLLVCLLSMVASNG